MEKIMIMVTLPPGNEGCKYQVPGSFTKRFWTMEPSEEDPTNPNVVRALHRGHIVLHKGKPAAMPETAKKSDK